jgi:hypothetical protein
MNDPPSVADPRVHLTPLPAVHATSPSMSARYWHF